MLAIRPSCGNKGPMIDAQTRYCFWYDGMSKPVAEEDLHSI